MSEGNAHGLWGPYYYWAAGKVSERPSMCGGCDLSLCMQMRWRDKGCGGGESSSFGVYVAWP